jgi:acyl carrier protein
VEDLFVEIPLGELKQTDSFSADIGLDSVGPIELFSIIEDKYGIAVNTDQGIREDYRTIQSMTEFIWNSLQGSTGRDREKIGTAVHE